MLTLKACARLAALAAAAVDADIGDAAAPSATKTAVSPSFTACSPQILDQIADL